MIVRFKLSEKGARELQYDAKRQGHRKLALELERSYTIPRDVHCDTSTLKLLVELAEFNPRVPGNDIAVLREQAHLMSVGLAREAGRPRGEELGPAPHRSFLARQQMRIEAEEARRRRKDKR